MYYVYMIRCEDGSLYTGSTDDPERRFAAHAAGKGAKYTKSHRPAELAAVWTLASRPEALRLEYRIKRLNKKEKERIVSGGPFPESFQYFRTDGQTGQTKGLK